MARGRADLRAVSIRTAAALVLIGVTAWAQGDAVKPTNDLPNPYRTVENFLQMPPGRTWGSTSAVAIDKDGRSIWVAERCGANSCLHSDLPVVLKFDPSGQLVKAFGAGLFVFPHGIDVDPDGNVWVTDDQDDAPRPQRGQAPGAPVIPRPGATRGHQIFKFSPDGKLLMTLGRKGGAAAPDFFYQPNAVLVAPDGNIFVAQGHGAPVDRIFKFSKDGKLIKSWGKRGTGPGEFDQPHTLALDAEGRLFVGDRSNNRIQIFDQDGNYITEWKQFSRPSGIVITGDDTIYVADSESESVSKNHDGWKRGIRIGSAKDGSVKYFIPDPVAHATGTSSAEGIAVDPAGNIYGAEVGQKDVKKYVRK
ncbi:MAG: peptidyl-alpha-hydroxyglycine alpha-amidating lyase family protein [Betaproteobacteria bacterium]